MRLLLATARSWARPSIAALISLLAFCAAPAWAAPKAEFVLDATTGRVLHSRAGDARRYPASLTKMMTLYLLFQDMERGEVQSTTPLLISEHASAQAPSRLGVQAGDQITVEDAIQAVVTLSANDVAVAIAENLAGSESAFAARMTETAHSLGMHATQFRNASGLPDARQYTTAADMALLGAALQARYPDQYRYFNTTRFSYDGRVYKNHNHLLSEQQGIDGIKTGYTQASGFNIVTSVRRDNRKLITVVMGGSSIKARDSRAAALLKLNFQNARPGDGYYAELLAAVNRASPTQLAAVSHAKPPAPAALSIEDQYAIQLGAYSTRDAAQGVINRTRFYVQSLIATVEPSAEPVAGKSLFRVRFKGFGDLNSAQGACKVLELRDVPCLAIAQ